MWTSRRREGAMFEINHPLAIGTVFPILIALKAVESFNLVSVRRSEWIKNPYIKECDRCARWKNVSYSQIKLIKPGLTLSTSCGGVVQQSVGKGQLLSPRGKLPKQIADGIGR